VDRPPAPARLARALAIALIACAVVPWPALGAEGDPSPAIVAPEPTPEPTPPPAAEPTPAPTPEPAVEAAPVGRVTVDRNLYVPYAIVKQYTSYWCVPANAQTMVNLVLGRLDRTSGTQARYAWHVRRYNGYRYPTRGNDPRGWARFLDLVLPGDFHYADRSFATKAAAIAAMVESIDRTGHPVGIVVDRGTHAWTVLGYRASMIDGDPSTRVVDGLYVSGSLYPLRRTREPFPYRFLTLDAFRARFTKYHESSRRVIWEGKFVIISE
jgi:hypothetical protein